jgi:hypothetical protein
MSDSSKKSLVVQLAIVTSIAFAIFIVLSQTQPTWVNPYVWYVILAFAGISYASTSAQHVFLEKKDHEGFQNSFYVSKAVKMFLSLVVIASYLYFNGVAKYAFAGDYILVYFLYMAFEIKFLLTNLQSH